MVNNYYPSVLALFLFGLSLGLGTAHAGTSCKDTNHSPRLWQTASQKAIELKKALDKTKAEAVLVARVGSDISKHGLYYTHVAFAAKGFHNKKNQWTIVHLLNGCGTASSHIHAQGLMNFFLDDLLNNDFEVIVPSTSVQNKIVQALRSGESKKVHGAHYSMLAYPFARKYQNSNQWILETIAAAETGKYSRTKAQAFLQKTGYQPSVIKISGAEKFGASLFKQNISFDDHPRVEQQRNQYAVVTVDSIVNWLRKNGQLEVVHQYRS